MEEDLPTAYRVLQIVTGVGLGILSLVFMGPEIRRCDASVSPSHQVLGAMLIAAAYFAIGFFATKDLRASSLLATCVTVVSTPIYGFIWIMSQWTPQSAEAARPLLFYIAANVILLISSVMAMLKLLSAKSWHQAR